MSKYITADNLDEVIEENKKIKDDVEKYRIHFLLNYNNLDIKGGDRLAFEFLKNNYIFLQVPIPDRHYGGAIIANRDLKVPIINTSRPRVQQYFVAWHEIYHLLYDTNLSDENHVIQAEELELNERKADYFAAKILIGDVYKYFYKLGEEDFLFKIARCIDLFKVPYKAILIELYEEAKETYNDEKIMKLVKENFDKDSDFLLDIFEDLGLDTELLKPSNILNLGNLDKRIKDEKEKNPDLRYHDDNLKIFLELKEKLKEGILKHEKN